MCEERDLTPLFLWDPPTFLIRAMHNPSAISLTHSQLRTYTYIKILTWYDYEQRLCPTNSQLAAHCHDNRVHQVGRTGVVAQSSET